MAVVEDPAPFTLTAVPDRLALKPGEKGTVKVQVKRGAGFEGEVALTTIAGVPGLKAPTGKIEKGKDEASLEVALDGSATPGRTTIAFLGEADAPFARNPGDKKANVKVRIPTSGVSLDVVAAPFEVRIADLHGGKLAPGGSLGVDVAVSRKFGFDGGLVLSLVPPEAVKDLEAPEVRMARDASSATLTVKQVEAHVQSMGAASGELFGSPVTAEVKLSLEVEAKK